MAVQAILIVVFALFPAYSQCLPSQTDILKYPLRKYTGAYRNLAYGFALVIPKGLSGVDVRNPSYQRGFTIFLNGRKSSVTASGAVNSLEYKTAREAAESDLDAYKQLGRKQVSSNFEPSHLGEKPAWKLRFRYTCPPSQTEYLLVETIAVNTNIYTVLWEGPAALFDRDQEVVRQLEKSWKPAPIR